MKASILNFSSALALWLSLSTHCYGAEDNYFNSTLEETWAEECDPSVVVSYKMVLKTHWTEESFPKNYPKWRPPAQWSTVFVQTHNADYSLFSIGKPASNKLRAFTERGDFNRIMQVRRNPAIFDQIITGAIMQGAGETQKDFFVHGNHSKVSLISKIVPSPDWFIGVDGFNLCSEGLWLDNINITLGPLDGGTEGGLTFTSPKWRLQVPDGITQITSNYPRHRAASFYYPKLEKLPNIATVYIIKIEEHPLEKCEENVTVLVKTSSDMEALKDTLSPETLNVYKHILDNYEQQRKYSPKLFRPRIIFKDTRHKSKKKPGYMYQTMLPIKQNTTVKSKSYFRW